MSTNEVKTNSSSELTAKTLDELEAQHRESLLESLVCLVDISGSMDGYMKSTSGKSKHSAAQEALNLLWEKTHWELCDFQVFAFDTTAEPLECSESFTPVLPFSRGGTDFSSAIASALDKNPTRIILCSDGQAPYPDQQILTCQQLSIPIDTIYIEGNDYDSEQCKALLQRISDETGGRFTTVDNAEDLSSVFAQLETTERLLLGYDPDSDPIEL